MRILLTGASGMVGRNLLEHTKAGGHQWLTPARRELDLRDAQAVSSFMARHAPDMVVHAAGKVGGIRANIADPVGFLVENWDIGRNVMLAARDCAVPRLLNLGSSCMYPRDRDRPLCEEEILQGELEPTNEGYAIAKIATQRLCSYISRTLPQLRYRTAIPCNLYGRWDDFSPESAHLVAAALRKVHDAKRDGLPNVSIWGDGRARREFMYAADLADFVFEAIDRFDQLPEVLNVGMGTDHSVDEYYRAAAKAVGYQGAFAHDPGQPAGMQRKLVDIGRLAKFGWRARVDLERGLAETYRFFQELHA